MSRLTRLFRRRPPEHPCRHRLGAFHRLEDRVTPAVFTVTNGSNFNIAGSLLTAVLQANANPDQDVIVFAPNMAGATVPLGQTYLPLAVGTTAFRVSSPVTILGSGQTLDRTLGNVPM